MEWDGGGKREQSKLPAIVLKAKEKHVSAIDKLGEQRKALSRKLDAEGVGGTAKNKLLVPVIEEKFRHQNAVKAIDAEWKED